MNNQRLKVALFVLLALLAVQWVYYDTIVRNKAASRGELLRPVDLSGSVEDVKEKSLIVLARSTTAAVATTTVSVSSCVTEPYALRAIYGEKIAFANADDAPQTLVFASSKRVTMPSKGTVLVSTTDMIAGPKKPRAYVAASYTCEGRSAPAGIITLTD